MKLATRLPAKPGLHIQHCNSCGHYNYPPRELCGNCLADSLEWAPVDGHADILSVTTLHYSLEENYRAHLPWPVASLKLAAGPVLFAHLQPGLEIGDQAFIKVIEDTDGNRMLAATANNSETASWLQGVRFTELSA